MATIIINGVELEYRALSASFIRKTETALNKMRDSVQETEEMRGRGQLDYAGAIEKQALSFANVFDEIFGEGTANKMFGDVIDDVSETARAIQKLIDFKREQEGEFASGAQNYSQKYNPVRGNRPVSDMSNAPKIPLAIPTKERGEE